jgi:hypothetical protein
VELQRLRELLGMLDLNPVLGSLVQTKYAVKKLRNKKVDRKTGDSVVARAAGRRVTKKKVCWSPEPSTGRKARSCPTSSCSLCGDVCRTFYWLKVHLTLHHFYAQVARMVAQHDAQCDLCATTFTGFRAMYTAVVHRGAVHGAVLPLLQARYAYNFYIVPHLRTGQKGKKQT